MSDTDVKSQTMKKSTVQYATQESVCVEDCKSLSQELNTQSKGKRALYEREQLQNSISSVTTDSSEQISQRACSMPHCHTGPQCFKRELLYYKTKELLRSCSMSSVSTRTKILLLAVLLVLVSSMVILLYYHHIHKADNTLTFTKPAENDNKPKPQQIKQKKRRSPPHMIKDPNFNYIINNTNLCGPDTNVFVWVHSAPDKHRNRVTIRETWANTKHFPTDKGYKVKLGFFLGAIKRKYAKLAEKIRTKVMFESEKYGDIIQEDYVDHYHNMSYKAISAVRWITRYCSQAKLVIKSDDDALVDLPLLLQHIHSLQASHQMDNNTILCRVYKGPRVEREGKWRITRQEYRRRKFPNYCQGLALAMTGDVVPQLYNASRQLTPMWIDDAWMFGVVAEQTTAKLHQVYIKTDDRLKIFSDSLFNKEMGRLDYSVFYHLHRIDVFHKMWRYMNARWISFLRNSVNIEETTTKV